MTRIEKTEYSNLLSRLLLKSSFERQFVIPPPPHPAIAAILRFIEHNFIRVDTSKIAIDRPIFLIALPRAGASMIQNVLCTHPDLAYITNAMHQFRQSFCAAEVMRRRLNLDVRGERYLGDSVVVDVNTPADGVAFWGEWLHQDPESLDYDQPEICDFSASEIREIEDNLKRMIWCFNNADARFLTKNPALLPYVPVLSDLFPDAKFVHIVRDPRMAANSLLKLYRLDNRQLRKISRNGQFGALDVERGFVPYPRLPNLAENVAKYGADDIRTTAHLWNDAVTFVNEQKARLRSFHEVRYEDILANPEDEISKLFQFLELPPVTAQNQAFQQRIGEVGVLWHKNEYEDFNVVESICRDNMRKYGYLN